MASQTVQVCAHVFSLPPLPVEQLPPSNAEIKIGDLSKEEKLERKDWIDHVVQEIYQGLWPIIEPEVRVVVEKKLESLVWDVQGVDEMSLREAMVRSHLVKAQEKMQEEIRKELPLEQKRAWLEYREKREVLRWLDDLIEADGWQTDEMHLQGSDVDSAEKLQKRLEGLQESEFGRQVLKCLYDGLEQKCLGVPVLLDVKWSEGPPEPCAISMAECYSYSHMAFVHGRHFEPPALPAKPNLFRRLVGRVLGKRIENQQPDDAIEDPRTLESALDGKSVGVIASNQPEWSRT